jgi:hypothetical protein
VEEIMKGTKKRKKKDMRSGTEEEIRKEANKKEGTWRGKSRRAKILFTFLRLCMFLLSALQGKS